MQKLQARCEDIVTAIEQVSLLTSPGRRLCRYYGTFECDNCKTVIKRRLPPNVERRTIECWECKATYNMSHISDGQVHIEPQQLAIPCVDKNCETDNYIWENKVTPGLKWECHKCGIPQKLAYGVVPVSNHEAAQ